ncbi:MAG: hypothetical protein K8S27_11650 [Candidatus Omnitrophica bacterium]|nr:hypothetical protein [Candidatus Omnitrophota bacterium]
MKKINMLVLGSLIASLVFVCPLFAQQCDDVLEMGESYFKKGKKAEDFRQYYKAIESYMLAEREFQQVVEREDCTDAHVKHMAQVNLTFCRQNLAKNRRLAVDRKVPNDFEAGVLKYEQGVRFSKREQWRHAMRSFDEAAGHFNKAYQTTAVSARKIESYEKKAKKEAKKIRRYLGK